MIELKVIDHADQQFGAVFNGQRVTLRLRYNVISDRWSFDMALDDDWILYGRRIVNGVNFFRPFDSWDLGVFFAFPVTADSVPDRASLPAGLVRLFHVDPEELEAILEDGEAS